MFSVSCLFGNGIFPEGTTFCACVIMSGQFKQMLFALQGTRRLWGVRSCAAWGWSSRPHNLPASQGVLEKSQKISCRCPSLAASPPLFSVPLWRGQTKHSTQGCCEKQHLRWDRHGAADGLPAAPDLCSPLQLHEHRVTWSQIQAGNHPRTDAQTPLSWEPPPVLPFARLSALAQLKRAEVVPRLRSSSAQLLLLSPLSWCRRLLLASARGKSRAGSPN